MTPMIGGAKLPLLKISRLYSSPISLCCLPCVVSTTRTSTMQTYQLPHPLQPQFPSFLFPFPAASASHVAQGKLCPNRVAGILHTSTHAWIYTSLISCHMRAFSKRALSIRAQSEGTSRSLTPIIRTRTTHTQPHTHTSVDTSTPRHKSTHHHLPDVPTCLTPPPP